jgi:dolichyl-phosphate-mannose-protein mannosyltransferase
MLGLNILSRLTTTVVPTTDLSAVSSRNRLHGADKSPHPGQRDSEPEKPDGSAQRSPWLFVAVGMICLVYLAGLFYYAHVRPLDGDEGYYTTAARLVWEGKTPYRDFAYPQGPLLPYIYSWVWAVHPRSLVAMRVFSAACGGIGVLLWGWSLLSVKTLPTKVALATFAIVLLNPYWVSWNVVIKTFAVANLLISIVMISFYLALRSGRSRWYIIAGLALGACASVRLLYAPLLPFVLVWMLYKDWRSSGSFLPRSLSFLVGAICGLLPMIVSFLGDPQAFIFNNLRYHPLLASHVSLRHTIHLYSNIALSLLHAKYFVAEMALVVIGVLGLLKRQNGEVRSYTREVREYLQLALLMLLVYIGAALVPFPPFDQYFDSPLVPFTIPFMAEGLGTVLRFKTRWVFALIPIAPILFLMEVNRDAVQCSSAPALRLSSYQKVTRIIEANTKADDVVLSFWSGYVFESGRQYFPGSEDKFNYSITPRMRPEERSRYHVVSRDEVIDALSARAVGLLITYPRVFDKQDDNTSPNELQKFQAALNAGYSRLAQVDDIGIYQIRASVPRQALLEK